MPLPLEIKKYAPIRFLAVPALFIKRRNFNFYPINPLSQNVGNVTFKSEEEEKCGKFAFSAALTPPTRSMKPTDDLVPVFLH